MAVLKSHAIVLVGVAAIATVAAGIAAPNDVASVDVDKQAKVANDPPFAKQSTMTITEMAATAATMEKSKAKGNCAT